MAIFKRKEKRSESISDNAAWLKEAFGATSSASGVTVNENTAMKLAAVYACVNVISEDIAKLPLITYRRNGRGRDRATDHPLYRVLHTRANPEMSSFQFRKALTAHKLLWGNGYSEIERNGAGQVVALWPLRPDKMEVFRNRRPNDPIDDRSGGDLVYRYTLPDGTKKVFLRDEILHLPGLSFNGITGLSVISYAKETIGLGLAAQEFGSRFFSNDARPGVVLVHKGTLNEDTHDRLKKSWNATFQGLKRSHRVAILEEGMDVKEIGIPPQDAQFLETRKFQVREINRWYRVPPHKTMDLDNATFSNIEHQGIEYVTDCLMGHTSAWEQEIMMRCLLESEQDDIFVEFLMDALLRGDTLTRYQAYQIGRQYGWMSANDIREKENMNPLPGKEGDIYLVPLNMVNSADLLEEDEPEPEPEPDPEDDEGDGDDEGEDGDQEDEEPTDESNSQGERELRHKRAATQRHRLARAYRKVFTDAMGRIIRREVNEIKKGVDKNLRERSGPAFFSWLEDYFRGMEDVINQNLLPCYSSYAEAIQAAAADEIGVEPGITPEIEEFVRTYCEDFTQRYISITQAQLRKRWQEAIDNGLEAVDLIDEELAGWEENDLADSLSLKQVVGFGAALAGLVWMMNGRTAETWVCMGDDPCPFCLEMDGRTSKIDESFLDPGQEVKGGDSSYPIYSSIPHPPLHDGCECQVVAD